MAYDARAVANLLLDVASVQRTQLTMLALQKLLFFSHGWYLAAQNAPLIVQDFEAWNYGPVVRVVYETLEVDGDRPIQKRAHRFDPVTGEMTVVEPNLTRSDQEFVGLIYNAYGRFDPLHLSRMTHVSGSPWEEIRRDSRKTVNIGMKIPNSLIYAYFSKTPPYLVRH